MWLTDAASGRRGTTCSGSCISCHISSVTSPVASDRGVCITSFSNAHTEALVRLPNSPSIGPGSKPSSLSRSWTAVTSSPDEPSPIVSDRFVLTSGAVVGGAVVTATVDVVAIVLGVTVSAAGFEPDDASESPPNDPEATPATTTVPMSAQDAMAGAKLDVGGQRAASGSGGGGGRSSHPTAGPPSRPIGWRRLSARSRAVHMSPRNAANVCSSSGWIAFSSRRKRVISRTIVAMIPGELSVDSPIVRGK